jgi:hypothetical protein
MRRRKATVELFEQIRREYEFGLGTIQGVARQFGVHRRLVREAVAGAVPGEKAPPVRPRPRLEPVVGFIDGILDADQRAPRKQRHTAHRIYERLRQARPEHGIAESTVRRYVRERKAALGLLTRETFVPQSYAWGARRRSIGTKRRATSATSGSSCRCLRGGAWPAGPRSIAPIATRPSKRSWRPTSEHFTTSGAASAGCGTTT